MAAADVASLLRVQRDSADDAKRGHPARQEHGPDDVLGQEQDFQVDNPENHSLSDVYLFDGLKARDMAGLMRDSQIR